MNLQKYLKICVLTLCILAINISSVLAAESKALTIEEFKAEAIKNSPDLKTMETKIEQLTYQTYINYNNFEDAQYGSIMVPGIYLPGALDNIKQSKKVWRDSKDNLADLKRSKEDFLLQIDFLAEKLYIETLILEKQASLLEKNYQHNLKQLNVLKVRKELGMITEEPINELSVAASSMNNELRHLKKNIGLKKWDMNDMIGRDINTEIIVEDFDVKYPLPIVASITSIENSLDNIAILEQQKRDLEKLEKDLRDLKNEDSPDSNQEAILNARIIEAELKLKNDEKDIKSSVESLVANLNKASKAYSLANLNYENAKKTLDWNKQKYELGVISQLDLSKYQNDFLEIENSKREAEYNYLLTKHTVELAEKGILLGQR